jgi:pimeloyl-ACP methyl ester carboxylesterase
LAAGIGAAAAPSRARAGAPTVAFAPCADTNNFACGHLRVPLDPSGVTPGTITLALRRHRAPVGEARDAVIALAGGPGQAALPFAEQFARMLGPIVATRDLIVFDQRGTGLSDPLSCRGVKLSSGGGREGAAVAACAAKIGSVRTFFTTAQSAADIEAIRQAGGYEKLVLYGTSYGTKVAERYAQSYPTHVEALVLDSVVPSNGPDPLDRSTFAAVPRILRQLCAGRACRHVTHSPRTDLMRLVRRIGRGALRAHWIDGHGHARAIKISSDEVLEALVAGDLEPALRAEFPAAVLSAARGDDAALARMLERAASAEESELETAGSDDVLDLDTSCEEQLFPWSRQATPSRRLAEAKAAIAVLRAGSVAPFTRRNMLDTSYMPDCAFWPYTTPAPAPDLAPFPAVPTLILSGEDDLRTPTGDARELAAAIPGSHLLVVPDVGHSVLGVDPSGCAARALQALFAGKPIAACARVPLPAFLRPTPVPPARLLDVPPSPGNHGRPGRTLQAVVLTLADLGRQLTLQVIARLAQGSLGAPDVGGLRAGWAGPGPGTLLLHGYSYVPGVVVSGKLSSDSLQLRVSGAAAARGALHTAPAQQLIGTLGGQPVHLPRLGAGPVALAGTAARLAELTGASR